MDDCEKVDEISLAEKEDFHIHLNMEDIIDAGYAHTKRVRIQENEYDDLYVQSDTLLLANVFENFSNMCINVYELDPANFLQLQDQHGKQL